MRVIVSLAALFATSTAASATVVDEIIVSAVRGDAPPVSTTYVVDADEITSVRAVSLSDALSRAPSASLQTNSRGETLVFFRGAGERQTALFFDGAAINVPWDNRLDVSLLPSRAISQISTIPGVSSVLYGANAAGGVIDIAPISGDAASSVDLQGGKGGFFDGGGSIAIPSERVNVVASGGFTRRNGVPLSSAASLPFSQNDDALRANTDLRRVNGVARLELNASEKLSIAASVLAVDAEFGIAPEGNLNPQTENVRFWRFPDRRHIVGVLNVSAEIDSDTSLRSTVWVQRFDQVIESFASDAYEQIEDIQIDDDNAIGARVVVEHAISNHEIRAVATAIDARHLETNVSFENGAPPETPSPVDRFRRRTVSVGAEYAFERAGSRFWVGAGGDFTQSLETGGRPDAGGVKTWNAIGGVERRISDAWTLSLAAGRKTRLPTQRELFGTAINRFLLNPDLQAERSILTEAPLRYQGKKTAFTLAPFANFTTNTIDQRNVVVDGVRLRQRVNLRGSRGFGIEAFGETALTDHLSVSGNLTALRLRRRPDADDDLERFLSERTQLLARATLNYVHPSGWSGMFETLRRGAAYTLNEEDVFEPLARSTSFNAEIAYRMADDRGDITLFLRGDNLTDALIEPQLGLPAAGRLVRIGLRASPR